MERRSPDSRSEGVLPALYRAYGNEGAGSLLRCPRPNFAAVFCYSCAWVLQGNLAPHGWGGGQASLFRPISL